MIQLHKFFRFAVLYCAFGTINICPKAIKLEQKKSFAPTCSLIFGNGGMNRALWRELTDDFPFSSYYLLAFYLIIFNG